MAEVLGLKNVTKNKSVITGHQAHAKLLVDKEGPTRQHRQMLEAVASMAHAFFCKCVHDELHKI